MKRKYTNRELVSRVSGYFNRYRKILFTDLFCAGLTTVAGISLPLILRKITNQGAQGLIEWNTILQLTAIFVFLKIVEVFAGYYMTRYGHIMGAKIETDMRRDVFHHLHSLSDSYFNDTKVGQIMARITSDLFDITEFAHHCPEEYFIGAIQILVSFVILIRINIPLTVVIYTLIPAMAIAASSYNQRMRKTFKEQKDHIGDLNSQIEDSLLGVKVVKSFANEDIEKEKFEKGNQKFLGIKDNTYKNMAGFTTITRIFDGLMYLVVILGGGLLLTRGFISSGDLVAYILFVQTLLTTVKRIVEFTEQFHRGMTGIERFVEIMDQDIEIFDNDNAIPLDDVKGKVQLQNVSFRYREDEEIILEDINLTINPGESVALVGPSGGGKTTLCNLIPRFYDVSEGKITIDDVDIRNIQLKSLRENIGMVQQDVYLFSGTVAENIQYGKPGATMEEIKEAAKMAGAYDFIMDLPQGFDTFVGERGLRLSGGQKQRISIARVFLKNPPILILDEATSALDNKSEGIVQESLEKLSKGRSSLTIAHRLTTIQNADTIIVLTENGIVERGNHEELMAKKGYYYQLYTQGGKSLESMDLKALQMA
ncbi:MAG: ABC transporter ATP-binding protein [Tissierellia bacterium]|nr:ABC transporter ATP-binding protein [Tissierellia bacterium]